MDVLIRKLSTVYEFVFLKHFHVETLAFIWREFTAQILYLYSIIPARSGYKQIKS